jgi:ribonuclease D
VDETPTDAPEPTEPPAPLLELRDGLPAVVDTPAALTEACAALAAGTGPVAIDAERASGYRYGSRAYLIQLRREGSTTALIDPIAFDSLAPLQEVLAGNEWVLHAATQDLPCLAEVGLVPDSVFDTELAGRLLGFPRVGLATLVEELLGRRLRKEHSAVDWSTRPLPLPWLEYAALDVEVLVELRDLLAARLAEAGKQEWAAQEFAALLSFQPAVRVDPWRRTSGAHRVRGRRAMAVVRSLWETRDRIGRERDISPSRLIPDASIVVAAQAMPTDTRSLLETPGFHGRGARRHARQWIAAIDAARQLPERDLPGRASAQEGPPTARAWADKDPVAARRLVRARAALVALGQEVSVPPENLLTTDHLRRVLWTPPATRDPERLAEEVADQLRGYGARDWQVEQTVELLVDAILTADTPPPEPAEPELADG